MYKAAINPSEFKLKDYLGIICRRFFVAFIDHVNKKKGGKDSTYLNLVGNMG